LPNFVVGKQQLINFITKRLSPVKSQLNNHKMKNLFKIGLLVLTVAFSQKCYTQNKETYFEHLDVQSGLPESQATDLLQDKLGYIWLGTLNGLVRYDGYNAKVYELGAEKRENLKDFAVSAICEGNNGIIWVSTINGIFRYDRGSDTFTQFNDAMLHTNKHINSYRQALINDDDGNLWIYYDHANDAYYDHDIVKFNANSGKFTEYPQFVASAVKTGKGEVWFGTGRGLMYYNKSNQKMTGPFTPLAAGKRLAFLNLYEAPSQKGVLWFSMSDTLGNNKGFGLFSFDIGSHTFKQYAHSSSEPKSLLNDTVEAIKEDKQQRLWVGTTRGISRLDRQTGQFKNYAFADIGVYQIEEKPDGKLYLLTDNGITEFNPANGSSKKDTSSNDVHSLAGDGIRKLLVDHNGLLWAGLANGGLDHENPLRSKFDVYQPDLSRKDGYPAFTRNGIRQAADGYCWMGSDEGLVRWKPNTDSFQRVKLPGTTKAWVRVKLIDRDGLLWCVSEKLPLFTYNPKTSAINDFKSNTELTDPIIFCEDHKGIIWIGSSEKGLFSYNKKTRKFTHYPYETHSASIRYDGKKLDGNQVTAIFEDSQGVVWIGIDAEGGLDRFNREDGTFTSFLDRRKGLWAVTSIFEDHMGRFWVGTYMRGLFLFDRKTGESRNFTTRDGLLQNQVEAFQEDKNGKLWLTNENGITAMDPNTNTFTNYTTANALPFVNMGRAFFKLGDGEFLYQVAEKGMITFRPEMLTKNLYPPQVNIESLTHNNPRANNDSATKVMLFGKNKIELPHSQNRIIINYVALHYADALQNQYACQLIGYDKNWVKEGIQRSVTYTNLSPGTYTFRVKAANSDGVWNNAGASVEIVILPPWWFTWWAWLIYIALIVAAIYALLEYRTRKLVVDNQKLELEVVDQRDKLNMATIRSGIAADFHDELGSILSSIALYSEIAMTDTFTDEQRTKSILSLISESSRSTVSAMQDMIWAIQPKNDSMLEVINRIREYAYPIAELKNISLAFEIADNVPQLILPMDTRKNAYLVVKEALNNAFKYAGATHIIVEITAQNNTLAMEIKDNGNGFDPAAVKKGNGLNNMQKRADMAKGTLLITSKQGRGTIIIFNCPLSK
jgi:ligand-binding sensor domain-containing protein/signal transduction histidine kinase